MQICPNDLVDFGIRVGDPTRKLLAEDSICGEGEWGGLSVSRLDFEPGVIDGSPVESRRRSGFESG